MFSQIPPDSVSIRIRYLYCAVKANVVAPLMVSDPDRDIVTLFTEESILTKINTRDSSFESVPAVGRVTVNAPLVASQKNAVPIVTVWVPVNSIPRTDNAVSTIASINDVSVCGMS